MFKEMPNSNPSNPNETETIIGPSVRVEGDFITEGNIVVEGTVCGTLKTSRDLKVGAKSKIFANVMAENALISGEVQGNIKIKDKLELTSTAKIFGDVKTNILIIAAGSVLNGKCQMGDAKTKAPRPNFSKQEKIELKSSVAEPEEDVLDTQAEEKLTKLKS